MTADEAIQLVKSKAAGRTRFDGQESFLDEVLVAEIEWLRIVITAFSDVNAAYRCGRQPRENSLDILLKYKENIRDQTTQHTPGNQE